MPSKQKTGSLVVKMRVHGDKLIPIADQPVTTDGIPFKFASQTNTDSIGDTITGVESDTMMSDKYDSYDDELEMDMPESTDKQKMKQTVIKTSDIEEQAIEVKTENFDPDEDDNDLVNNFAELVREKKILPTKINSHGKPSTRSARRKAGVDKTKSPGIDDGRRDGDLIEDVSDLVSIIVREPVIGLIKWLRPKGLKVCSYEEKCAEFKNQTLKKIGWYTKVLCATEYPRGMQYLKIALKWGYPCMFII